MDERRKYVRIPEKTKTSYSILATNILGQDLTSDISQGGLRLIVHHFIPKNSRLKVKMNFGDSSTSIEAMVQLVWIRDLPYSGSYEIGVKFVDIPPKSAEYLLSYIKSFLSKKSSMGRYSI
jgi:c-di-GMP-binding flagellar brake protein YcgR